MLSTMKLSARAAAPVRRTRGPVRAQAAKGGLEGLREKAMVAVTPLALNALLAYPAAAKEAGKIFDFDYTLPAIAVQFLALMVVLDKLVYTPVGDILDNRDSDLKAKLASVKGNDGEIDALMSEAEDELQAAYDGVKKAIADKTMEVTAELEADFAKAKSKLEGELAKSLADLDAASAEAEKEIEGITEELSEVAIKKFTTFK